MSKTLKGANFAQLNKCTTVQNSEIFSENTKRLVPLAGVISALSSNDPKVVSRAKEDLGVFNGQLVGMLGVIAQCVLRDKEYHLDQRFYADNETVAQSIDLVAGLLSVSQNLSDHLDEMNKGGRNE